MAKLMANLIARVLRYFKAGTPSLNDYEIAILNTIAMQLPEELRERFRRRIDGVNLVHRLDGSR